MKPSSTRRRQLVLKKLASRKWGQRRQPGPYRDQPAISPAAQRDALDRFKMEVEDRP